MPRLAPSVFRELFLATADCPWAFDRDARQTPNLCKPGSLPPGTHQVPALIFGKTVLDYSSMQLKDVVKR